VTQVTWTHGKDALMDWTLEVVVLPVSDIDRSVALLPRARSGLGEWAGR
jgi:hypothetical protein